MSNSAASNKGASAHRRKPRSSCSLLAIPEIDTAIRDHKVSGKSLHLFQDKKDKRMLLYLGEMEYADHEIQPAARQGQKSQGCHYL
jgi:hypothetical protein